VFSAVQGCSNRVLTALSQDELPRLVGSVVLDERLPKQAIKNYPALFHSVPRRDEDDITLGQLTIEAP